MKKIEIEVINVLPFDTIDDLVGYAWHELSYSDKEAADFGGEIHEIHRMPLVASVCTFNNGYTQLRVSAVKDGFFKLQAVCGDGAKDAPTMTIPAGMLNELIATLKGEW